MDKRHCKAVILTCLFMLFYGHRAAALIPEPDNKLYGRAFFAGAQLTASDTDVTIILKVDGHVIASYRMGENAAAQDLYVLSVPLDALEPRIPDTARTGDMASIFVVANGDETFLTTVTIGPRGAIALVDISTDADGDGILDITDAFPLDPFESADTDGDNVGDNADTDDDNDGALDEVEIADGTNRLIPDVRILLRRGFNLVALPISPDSVPTSSDLLRALATNSASIRRYRPKTQPSIVTILQNGLITGNEFPILPNEGYELNVEENMQVTLTGFAVQGAVDLQSGPNLAGFSRTTVGTTAFDLLLAIGDSSVISGITRFNYETGRFQTVLYHQGQPSGSNFPISRGEAYWIFMKTDVAQFSPP